VTRRARARTLSVIVVGLVSALVPVAAADAATFTVTTTADPTGTCPTPNSCSLRQAVNSANATAGDDVITFSLPPGSTISLTNGGIPVNPTTGSDHTTIQGPGANVLLVRRDPSAPSSGVLDIVSGAGSAVSGLTLSGGHTTLPFTGGAMTITTPATLDGMSFVGNTADAGGGSNAAAGAVAGLASDLTIRNSAFVFNAVSNNGTGGSGGGLVVAGPNALIVNSTFSSNFVNAGGNRDGGGIMEFSPGVLTVVNTTIADNFSVTGAGGLRLNPGGLALANTILAGNTTSSGNPDCTSTSATNAVSQGYVLIGKGTGCPHTAATGDQVGSATSPIDPKLGPPTDNGGPTPTRALLSGSPAIDTGNPAAVSDTEPPPGPPALIPCRSIDQRGVARPQLGGCDIGAFELVPTASGGSSSGTGDGGVAPPPPAVVPPTLRILSTSVGRDGTITVNVENNDAGSDRADASFTTLTKGRYAWAARRKKRKKRPRRRTVSYGSATASTASAGSARLLIRPSAAAKRILGKGKRIRVAVRVTFTQTSGSSVTESTSVSVKGKKPRRKRR
jgi:CSLREA domain-containing protein